MDIYDLIALGGLGMLGYGIWIFSPAAALVVCGSLLLLLGISGARRKANQKAKSDK